MLETFNQVALTFLTITAMILVSRKNKWGFVVGLCSQPFWLMTSYLNKQWGIFITSIIYVGVWSYGIYQWFYKDKQKSDQTLKAEL